MKTVARLFFKTFQSPLLSLINTTMGRKLMGIEQECQEKILFLAPNAYAFEQDGRIVQVFRTYPLFQRKLITLVKVGGLAILPHQVAYAPLFIGEVSTFYSNASGDGMINAEGKATWALAHDATDGDAVYHTATAYLESSKTGTNTYTIHRVFLDFDTSSLPDGATITATTLYTYNNNDTTNVDSTDIVLVANSQADPTNLVVADYDQLGGTSIGATRPTIASLGANAYFSIALATGSFSQINKTGYTKLGLRVGRDIDNSAPTGNNYILISQTEDTGTTKDPYISVTYSTGGAFLFNLL